MLRTGLPLAALLVVAPAAAVAQPGDPGELAQGFFRTLQSGQVLKAYQDMWRDTLMDKKQAELESAATQTAAAMQIYGKILGWEQVSEATISPSFIRRVYLVKTENAPLFFRLQFYRAGARWVVWRLDFADKPDDYI
jgi:hypothetical protein